MARDVGSARCAGVERGAGVTPFTPNADRAEALAERALRLAGPESAAAELARAVLMLAVETRDVARDATQHEELRALTLAVERIALALEAAISGEKAVYVKQAQAFITREDRP